MSEDVEVLVTFGPSVSRNGRDRILKLLIQRVEQDIGVEATGNTAETSVHRARFFRYPQRYVHGALTGERVLLELGTRGGPQPYRRLVLRSLLAEIATTEFGVVLEEFAELAPLEIDTLAPERTVLESSLRCVILRLQLRMMHANTKFWARSFVTDMISRCSYRTTKRLLDCGSSISR